MNATFNGMSLLVFPSHCNPFGHLFGGTLLERIDICAGLTARQLLYKHPVEQHINAVTRHMSDIDFTVSADVGDLVHFTGVVTELGITSITIKVMVEKIDKRGTKTKMTSAEVVMCTVDGNNNKVAHNLAFNASFSDIQYMGCK